MIDDYTHFELKTREEVLALVKEHGEPDNLQEGQNDSPSMEELLKLADTAPSITFHGYIIGKERSDWRVTVEGFYIPSLPAEKLLDEWIENYRFADDCSWEKNKDGSYSFYTWWD